MKRKADRLQVIREIVSGMRIRSQEELLSCLTERGFELTQATLSRDLKQLQVAKVPSPDGGYVYVMSGANSLRLHSKGGMGYPVSSSGFVSIEFSGQIAVIKTRPGYASGIAYDIDARLPHEVIGTIAGDDTIMLVLREGCSHGAVAAALADFIPAIRE
ncbi:MAG: ArgR family transcriptional regulator [Coprobacter sp.]|nr:ArgR family transcriptional regulator [Coprobacter sp.]